jgi:glycosyltransferase involved in cell wall biosynthesis
MDSIPSISILMSVFNAEKYLREALDSIFRQTFSDFELVVVNDGSSDGSGDILRSLDDPRVRLLENEQHVGLVECLNWGIEVCRGKYIARMDADDVALPERLAEQYRFLETHPAIGVCGSWAQVIDGNGCVRGRIVRPTDPVVLRMHLLFSMPLVNPSCCLRAELLRRHRYCDVLAAEDYDLWCRMSEDTDMVNLPVVLLQYRWHDTNMSKEMQMVQEANKRMIIRRELEKLGIVATDEDLRIHGLSFSLHGFNRRGEGLSGSPGDLEASQQWFVRLMEANERVKRYPVHAFRAFLWVRWMILCVCMRRKGRIFCPAFASYHPRTLYGLGRQLVGLLRGR